MFTITYDLPTILVLGDYSVITFFFNFKCENSFLLYLFRRQPTPAEEPSNDNNNSN